MGFNTDQFSKVVEGAKANKGKAAVSAYRLGLTGAVIWLYANFASVKDVAQLREWVKSLSASRTAQIADVDKRLDALEKHQAYINGKLGLPMETATVTTNTIHQ